MRTVGLQDKQILLIRNKTMIPSPFRQYPLQMYTFSGIHSLVAMGEHTTAI